MKVIADLFGGYGVQTQEDVIRLTKQMLRIWDTMKDGTWRTLSEIETLTGDPQASISADLRSFRKEKFGAHTVLREHVSGGLWKYKLVPNNEAVIEEIRG